MVALRGVGEGMICVNSSVQSSWTDSAQLIIIWRRPAFHCDVTCYKESNMRRIVFYLLAGFSAAVLAAPLPYDESADAKAAVRHALVAARSSHLPVLIVFGANWCEDCRALDLALQKGQSAPLIAKSFHLVKVDVGNFNRNLDLAATYGNPIKKGIPAAVVVSWDNKVLYATKAGELASARRMSATGIHEFFKRVSQDVASSK
jgi:thioredoxin 1